jgi:hypothetical protein
MDAHAAAVCRLLAHVEHLVGHRGQVEGLPPVQAALAARVA